MKKGIIFILLIVFLLFVGTEIVRSDAVPATAASAPAGGASGKGRGGFFGGRIINTKALKIAELEASGFICFTPGTSISIIPIGSPPGTPISYFIPSFVTPKTRTTPATYQLIIGKYSAKTPIICIFPSLPPEVQTVSLDTITLFGTSRGSAASAVQSGPASPRASRAY